MSKPTRGEQRGRPKIGRNGPCPCQSGRKYKRCCGRQEAEANLFSNPNPYKWNQTLAERQGAAARRIRQQGLGRPFTSFELEGDRVVQVGDQRYWSSQWKTRADFLFWYIVKVLGREWFLEEVIRPEDARHPLIRQHRKIRELIVRAPVEPNGLSRITSTRAAHAYLRLADNLAQLQNSVGLQDRLARRLRDPENFFGAVYETEVAASFIRAGFQLELEDEADGSTTHCEFTATFARTGEQFSVEAKSRTPTGENQKQRVGRHLTNALRKATPHQRIVFIDVPAPLDETKTDFASWKRSVTRLVQNQESLKIDGAHLPPAYVVITYDNTWGDLDAVGGSKAFALSGFRMPGFNVLDAPTPTEFFEFRRKHRALYTLVRTLSTHQHIQQVFEAETPPSPIIIGRSYPMNDSNGRKRVGVIVSATVDERSKQILARVRFVDDNSVEAVTLPIDDRTLSIYQGDPDTFFGVRFVQASHPRTPVEVFELACEVYADLPLEELAAMLMEHPDYLALKAASREAMAEAVAEREVHKAWLEAHERGEPAGNSS